MQSGTTERKDAKTQGPNPSLFQQLVCAIITPLTTAVQRRGRIFSEEQAGCNSRDSIYIEK